MSKTYQNRQLDGGAKIKDDYTKINQNSDEIDADLTSLNDQLTEIINETDLDPNKDPEVTNARNNTPYDITYATVKENIDAVASETLKPKQLGGGLLINGNFDIWQRGVGPFAGGIEYTADRWKNLDSTDGSYSQVSGEKSKFAMRFTSNSAGSNTFGQLFENENNFLKDEVGKISFRARSSVNITALLGFRNDTKAVNIITTNVDYTPSWQTFEIDIPASSQYDIDDVLSLRLLFSAIVASGEWIEYDWVKIEKGDKATEFIPKLFAKELRDCKRYFQIIDENTYLIPGNIRGANSLRCGYQYLDEMRVNPTAAFSSAATFKINQGTSSYVNDTLSSPTSITKNSLEFLVVDSLAPYNTALPFAAFINTGEKIELDAEL